MKRFIILPALLQMMMLDAQVPDGFPLPGNSSSSKIKVLSTKVFSGESLFGYMNGGADLYLEYGFTDAVITEIQGKGSTVKCEIYRMKSPEAAFGIYSVSRFRCLASPPLSPFTCQNKYQLQVCMGIYYINIVNKTGSEEDMDISLEAATILSGQIEKVYPDIGAFIPGMNMPGLPVNARLVKGRLGLMNGAPEWEDFFSDLSGFTALIVPGEKRTVISSRFDEPEEFNRFITMHGWGTCDLSANGLKMPGGELIKLSGDTHLIVEIPRD